MVQALVLALIHFVADFLCQSSAMAVNKAKSLYWLTMHVLVYTSVLSLAAGMFYYYTRNAGLALIWLTINGLMHWVTDFFTSKLTSKYWHKEDKHWFFVTIGFDQLIHYSCLFMTYHYMYYRILF